MARFTACTQAAMKHEQGACEAAGGRWGQIGLHQGCNCPTGQAGCACTRAADCLSKCVAPTQGCADPGTGTWQCAPYHDVVGCHCYRDAQGGVGSICID
jgi:hypothetical protein